MPAFVYTALAADGGERDGRIEADDQPAAQRAVEALGLTPTSLQVAAPGGLMGARVPQAQVLAFARSLGGLVAAGVPLSRALTVIERESTHPAARAAWAAVHAQVRDGAPLADALAAQPGLFPPVFIAMVRAGEAGGFLATVLEQIADYLERSRELLGRVATALIYPALLAVVASSVVTFLLVWFIPRFATLFASFDRQLPLLTRIIQQVSVLLVDYGPVALAAVIVAVLAVRAWMRTPAGALTWERLLLRLPGVGMVRSTLARVRFCRMLGTLLGAGVPLMQALGVAREALGSQVLSAALADTTEQVRQGASLSSALSGAGAMMPPGALEAIAVAEGSGRLSQELLRLAEAGEKELDRRLRALVALAEPLLLLIMAALVGTIVVGMLLPIFDLWSAIS